MAEEGKHGPHITGTFIPSEVLMKELQLYIVFIAGFYIFFILSVSSVRFIAATEPKFLT